MPERCLFEVECHLRASQRMSSGPLGDIVSFYGPVLWRMTFGPRLQPFRNQSSKMVLSGNATKLARTKVRGEGPLLEIVRQHYFF
jgi:hypothetical protein